MIDILKQGWTNSIVFLNKGDRYLIGVDKFGPSMDKVKYIAIKFQS